jgi:hypothetical protein
MADIPLAEGSRRADSRIRAGRHEDHSLNQKTVGQRSWTQFFGTPRGYYFRIVDSKSYEKSRDVDPAIAAFSAGRTRGQ